MGVSSVVMANDDGGRWLCVVSVDQVEVDEQGWLDLEAATGMWNSIVAEPVIEYGAEVYGGCLEPGYRLETRHETCRCEKCGRWRAHRKEWQEAEGSLNTYFHVWCDACRHSDSNHDSFYVDEWEQDREQEIAEYRKYMNDPRQQAFAFRSLLDEAAELQGDVPVRMTLPELIASIDQQVKPRMQETY